MKQRTARKFYPWILIVIIALVLAVALFFLYKHLTYSPLAEKLGGHVEVVSIRFTGRGFVVTTNITYPDDVTEEDIRKAEKELQEEYDREKERLSAEESLSANQ